MTDDARARSQIFGEADRQAIDAMGGYAHQLLASALVWLRMPKAGELHLEVAEDYATAVRGHLDATQIKRTAGTVSLAAEPIRIAMRSFVRLVRLNPGMLVRLTFLTTANVTAEHQVAHRTGSIPGLIHWREVAEGAEAARIREVLLALELGEELHSFIRERDDGALRSDLLQRIDWQCGAADTAELDEVLRERVAGLCLSELDVPPIEGEQRADNVVQQVLRTCIRRTDRVLTHGGLRVVLRRATDIGLDRRTMNSLLARSGAPPGCAGGLLAEAGWSAESALPLPPFLVARPAVSALLIAALAAGRIALVQGSTGMGKTVAARHAARAVGGRWNLMECRNAAMADAMERVRSYAARPFDGATGVILDDVPDLRLLDEAPGLVAAVREILDRGETVIVTSANLPSPRMAAAIGLRREALVAVPLLTEGEVLDIVRLAEGHAGWAPRVWAASRGGHPQLANALVTGLKAREWPSDGSGTGILAGSSDVEGEFVAARRRLAATVPNQEARELLFRASIISDRFPRDLALALGAMEPSVPLPGEAFDALHGAWVDQVAPDRFRVSPLLQNAGYAVLAPTVVQNLHLRVAEALLVPTGLQADQADNIFFHGLAAEADNPLKGIAAAVILSSDAELWLLRSHMPRLAGADTSRPIAAWSPALAIELRLAQFLVLSARGVNERAGAAARALLAEMKKRSSSHRAQIETAALGKVLFRNGLSRHVPEWPEILDRLIGAGDNTDYGPPAAEDGPRLDALPSALFAFSISGLRTVAALADAFERVATIGHQARTRMLALDRSVTAPLVVALAPWLKERKTAEADGQTAAATYSRLARLTESWGERDWAVAFEAGAADIRSETDDPAGALRALEAAVELLGDDRWLRRTEQKIHSRLRHDGQVVEIVEQLEKAFQDLPIEQAHLLRDGAVSAARLGRNGLASRWFSQAAAFAFHSKSTTMRAMAAGLLADAAAETWRSGDHAKALAGMAAVLDSLAKVDPDEDVQSGFVHRIVRHSLLWFAREAGMRNVEVDGRPPALPPGTCSQPEPNETINEQPLTPLDLARSFLFQIASHAGLPDNVPDPGVGRIGLPILMEEIADRRARLDNAIAAASPDVFARLLRPAIDAALAALDLMEHRMMNRSETDMWRRADVPSANLADPRAFRYASSAIFAFRVAAGSSGRTNAAMRLRELLEASPEPIAAGIVQAIYPPGPLPRCGAREPEHCAGLVGRMDLGTGELLECCLRLLMRFHQSDFRRVVEKALAQWAKREWLRFTGERRFALSHALLATRSIEAAAAAAGNDFRGLASLTLAASIGADLPLPPNMVAWLRAASEAKLTE